MKKIHNEWIEVIVSNASSKNLTEIETDVS